jgi:hypothetical protein
VANGCDRENSVAFQCAFAQIRHDCVEIVGVRVVDERAVLEKVCFCGSGASSEVVEGNSERLGKGLKAGKANVLSATGLDLSNGGAAEARVVRESLAAPASPLSCCTKRISDW